MRIIHCSSKLLFTIPKGFSPWPHKTLSILCLVQFGFRTSPQFDGVADLFKINFEYQLTFYLHKKFLSAHIIKYD